MSRLTEAASDLGLRFADVKPGQGADPLPTNKYRLRIERWEETEADGSGKTPEGSLIYKVGFQVVGGEHDGEWVFDQLIIAGVMASQNLGRLKGLAAAAGIAVKVYDSGDWDPDSEWGQENLVGKEVTGHVVYRKANATKGTDAGNNIRKYETCVFTPDDMVE